MIDVAAILSTVSPLQWSAVLCASIAAAVFDFRSYRIPNPITFPLALLGLIYQSSMHGPMGLLVAIAAACVISAPYLVLFISAGGGGGDVKLMAAIGVWLGLPAGFVVLFCVAIAGIILGLVTLWIHRSRSMQQHQMNDVVVAPLVVPYGVAICAGLLVASMGAIWI